MNPNMNGTIRRLTSTFIIFFLIISGIAAYIQIGNQAFYQGPVLAHGKFDGNPDRNCVPYDAPIRGTIYDRNGVKLAWSVPDPNDPCIYDRKYDPRVFTSGLAPLLGYQSQQYGTAGLEATFNDQLAGVNGGQTVNDVVNGLLHKARYGQDVYLTIDINLQVAAAKYYQTTANGGSALTGGVCQNVANPPGSIIAEDPNTGEILAMVSFPSFDPNKIDTSGYFASLNRDPGHPLLNHATQGLYAPGSTFKTMTLLAALDSGQVSLDTGYNKDDSVTFHVPNGETITWYDYASEWQPYLSFPMPLATGFALSDNALFARLAVQLGGDTWLSYVRKFGIAEPGYNVPTLAFDGPYNQSSAYNSSSDKAKLLANGDLLAESGFGQGGLFITPLTMTELSSTIASSGQSFTVRSGSHPLYNFQSQPGTLYLPHSVMEVVPHDGKTPPHIVTPTSYTPDGAAPGPVIRPETTSAVRQAMWQVVSAGTAHYGLTRNGQYVSDSPVKEGGKTGTAQSDNPDAQTWWISLAPDDAAPGGAPAKMAVTVMKEGSGEGACQVFVADDTYAYAMNHHIGPYGQ